MKNRTTTIIVAVAIVLVGGAFAWYYLSDTSRTFSWRESYDPESKQPYGTSFIKSMLGTYREGASFTVNKKTRLRDLLPGLPAGTDLIFIGHATFLDSLAIEELLLFMERGNDVFIASMDPPRDVLFKLRPNKCLPVDTYASWREDEMNSNFFHPALRHPGGFVYRYRFAGLDRPYSWNSLERTAFCSTDGNLVPLGYHADDEVDFFKVPHGKGNLFVHANPIVFTNYFMVSPDKVAYADNVFSHLRGKDIVWDESSKLPIAQNEQTDFNSPLYFIMEQPALRYAWWMILLTVALFILFATRRKQRIIPVMEPKSNTSLEYVTLISALHYQNQDHLDMARKKMKYFLYFIRSRYGIQTASFSKEHVPVLAERAKVKLEDVNVLYDRWNVIEHFGHHQIEANRLINLYTSIDHFYRNCK